MPQPKPSDDDRAWDDIVRRHHRRVLVSVVAMGVGYDVAEDVVSETWTRLLERRRAGELQRVEMPGLAIAQARFLALDALRKQGRAARARELEREQARKPLDTLIDREQLARISRILADSPANARAVFLRAFDDPPVAHADIAREIGLSVQRVRQILWELRKRLRAEMGDDR